MSAEQRKGQPTLITTKVPEHRLDQRVLRVLMPGGDVLAFYSPSEGARVIGTTEAMVTKMMDRGDVRVLVSAGDRKRRMILKEDVDAIAEARRLRVTAASVEVAGE
jgi:hypothetical protein